MGTEERTGGSTASQISRLDLGIDLFKVGFRGRGAVLRPRSQDWNLGSTYSR